MPTQVLAAIAKALRPRGMFLMVDIAASSHLEENMDHPLAPFLYTISCNHCMTVSLAANGEGLGTMWGEQKARQMLSAAGFTQLEVMQVEGDIFNNYFIASKSWLLSLAIEEAQKVSCAEGSLQEKRLHTRLVTQTTWQTRLMH